MNDAQNYLNYTPMSAFQTIESTAKKVKTNYRLIGTFFV